MLKSVPCESVKLFNYQEWVGVHIHKLVYSKVALFGPRLQYTKLMPEQHRKLQVLEARGYEMINGYAIHGKVFSDPNDNTSGTFHPETNVIIVAKPGEKGAIAVLPNSEMHSLSSKSWKPSVEHFKV